MSTKEHDGNQSVSSYVEWDELFRPEKSVGEAVVVAFLLKNIPAFKEFVSSHQKSHQVAAQKWIADSIEDVQRSKQHYECAKNMGLPSSYLEFPDIAEWKLLLNKEAKEALILLGKSKS